MGKRKHPTSGKQFRKPSSLRIEALEDRRLLAGMAPTVQQNLMDLSHLAEEIENAFNSANIAQPDVYKNIASALTSQFQSLADRIPGYSHYGFPWHSFNVPPSFDKGGNQTVGRHAGPQTVVGWATDISAGRPSEYGQELEFHVIGNSRPGLFSEAPHVDAETGTLTYTPSGRVGTAWIVLVLKDDGGRFLGWNTSIPQVFKITVTNDEGPVNVAPSFIAGEDQTVNQDAGPQLVPNWATDISAGPASESGQSLAFQVTNNSNPNLFSAAPEVNAQTGTLSYTPAAGVSGTATITLVLKDNGGTAGGGQDTSAPQTFTITVNPVTTPNVAPTFTKGSDQTVNEDAGATTVAAWATNIMAPEAGQTLSFQITNNSNPSLFSAGPAIAADGTLTYTPAANANGSATITLVLKDDGGTANGGDDTSDEQTFTITVNPVNDAPVYTKGPDQTVNQNAGAQLVAGWATNISAGPANESAQTLSFQVTNNTNPSLFAAAPEVSAQTGLLSYTPAAGATGTATITLVLKDNGGTANGGVDTSTAQTFTITINAAPIVNDPPSFTKGADQTITLGAGAQLINGWATNIVAGPTDESGQALLFQVTGNTNPTLFSVAPEVNTSGRLIYQTAPGATGTATITLVLKDDGGTADGGQDTSAPQTFTITVNQVTPNLPPSFIKGADQTIDQDSGPQLVANWATNIAAPEAGQTLTFQVTGNTNPALFSAAPEVSAQTGTLSYTPAAGVTGTATITLVLKDNGGTANGGEDTSAPQTFTITVRSTAPNVAPEFIKGADQTVNEDAGAQTVNEWATSITAPEARQVLTFEVTGNTNPTLFAVAPAVAADGTLTYTPAANANGTATITLVLKDDGGTANGGDDTSDEQTFIITVNAVNDAPSFTKGADQSVAQDAGAQSVTGWATNISAGPSDESGQTLTFEVTDNTNPTLFSVAPAVSADGTLTYTPAAGATGSATITLVLKDDGGTDIGGVDTSAAQSFTITLTEINLAPEFTKGPDQTVDEDAGEQTVTGWATNISAPEAGQVLTFEVTGNTNPTLFSVAPAVAADGTLTYMPAANANGTATITLVLKDDGGTANGGVDTSPSQTFTITVNAVNDAPSFTKGADQSVPQDSSEQTVTGWATNISAGPTDESGQTLTFEVTDNTNPTLFSVVPAVSADGTLTFTPAAGATGSATITLVLKDDGGTDNGGVDTSAAQTFTITLTEINLPPEFTKGPDQTVDEDSGAQTVSGWATGILPGPPSQAGQVLTFEVTDNTNPTLFSVAPAVNADGTLTYTPAPNANGTATITLVLKDDGGTANGGDDTSDEQTFIITVNAVNDATSFTKGADQTVAQDAGAQSVTGWATNISAGPSDESGQTLTFEVTDNTNPTLFSVVPAVSADGTLTYTPAAGATGSATITLVLKDDGGTDNGGVDTSAAQTFTITIEQVEVPGFTVTQSDGDTTVSESGTTDTFTVVLNAQPATDVVLDVISEETGAATATPTTLTFTAANWNVAQTVTVTGVNDGVDDGQQVVPVTVSVNAAASDDAYDAVASQTVSVTVNPVEVLSAALSIPSTASGAPGGSVAVPVNIISGALVAGSGLASADLVVLYDQTVLNPTSVVLGSVLSSGTGWTVTSNIDAVTGITTPGRLVISASSGTDLAGTLNGPLVTINFTILQSAEAGATPLNLAASSAPASTVLTLNDGNPLTLSPAPTNNSNDAGVDGSVTVTTTTVPNIAPSFTKGADQTINEDAGAQSVTEWATGITAPEAGQTLTFEITDNSNPTLFSAAPAVSANGTLTYTPAANVSGTATITLILKDDGGTANGGDDASDSQTFTITVNSVNDAPSFTKGADQTVAKDAGAQSVPNWATNISANEPGQTLTFEVTGNSNPTLFSVAPSVGANGTLTYTPAAGATGTATITLVLKDDGGTDIGGVDTSAAQTFTITVNEDVVLSAVLSIPSTASGAPSSSVAVPVNIATTGALLAGTGLASADLVVLYDQTVLNPTSVVLGSVLSAGTGWTVTSNIDAVTGITTPGRLVISASSGTDLAGILNGALVTINFTILQSAEVGATPLNLAASSAPASTVLTLNDGNPLSLLPAPTNNSTDAGVDGIVTVNA